MVAIFQILLYMTVQFFIITDQQLFPSKKCKCQCNLFTHEAPKSSRSSFKGVHAFRVKLEFGNVGFVEGGKPENPEKNPRSKDENQQQTQPAYHGKSRNRTRATLVGDECSHHCANPAPRVTPSSRQKIFDFCTLPYKN